MKVFPPSRALIYCLIILSYELKWILIGSTLGGGVLMAILIFCWISCCNRYRRSTSHSNNVQQNSNQDLWAANNNPIQYQTYKP